MLYCSELDKDCNEVKETECNNCCDSCMSCEVRQEEG